MFAYVKNISDRDIERATSIALHAWYIYCKNTFYRSGFNQNLVIVRWVVYRFSFITSPPPR